MPGWFGLYAFLKFCRNGAYGKEFDQVSTLLDFVKEAQDLMELKLIDPQNDIKNFIKEFSGFDSNENRPLAGRQKQRRNLKFPIYNLRQRIGN